MKLYEFKFAYGKAVDFDYVNEKDEPSYLVFNREPRKATWKPIPLKLHNSKMKNKLTDMAYFIPDLISERTMLALSPLVGEQAEFLPMEYEDKPYYILNTIHHVDMDDVLDYNLTILRYGGKNNVQKKGKPTAEDGMPWDAVRLNFIPEKLKGHHIFCLKGIHRYFNLVSEDFKKIIDDNHFTGFEFELVWDEDIDYVAIDEDMDNFKKSESYYPIVRWVEKPSNAFTVALRYMKKNMKFRIYSGLPVAKQVSNAVDEYLETGIIPPYFKDLDDYIYHLSMCYTDAFATLNPVHGKEVGDEHGVRWALVADNEYYVFFVIEHIKKIMEGKNENGNDLLFLLEDIAKRPHGEKRYMPIV